MVTDDEKARIRAEEIFRLEVRRELEAGKPRRSRRERIWAVLNASFVLWLLSSVLLAGLTAAFARYQEARGEQLRKAETEQRIITEISNRAAQALAGLRVMEHNTSHGSPYAPRYIYQIAALYLNNLFRSDKDNPQDFSVYPEYRERTFRSLLFELSSVASPAAQPQIRKSLAGVEQLADLGSFQGKDASLSGGALNRRESLDAVRKARRLIESVILSERLRSPVVPELGSR